MQSFRNDLEKVAPCLLRLIQTLRSPWLWFLKSSSQLKVFLHTWPSGSVWRSHFNDTVDGGDDIGLSSLFCPEGEEALSGSDGDEGGEGCAATSTLPLSWTGVRWISAIASSDKRSFSGVGTSGGYWRGLAGDEGAGFRFLPRNISLRLAFLLMVDGLGFFLGTYLTWMSEVSTFVSREKEKVEPIVRENLNAEPRLLSVWQKSRHLLAKSVSPIAVIFSFSSEVWIYLDGPDKQDILPLQIWKNYPNGPNAIVEQVPFHQWQWSPLETIDLWQW